MLGEEFNIDDLVMVCYPEEVAEQLHLKVQYYAGTMVTMYGYNEERRRNAGQIATIIKKASYYLKAACPPGGSAFRYELDIDKDNLYRDYQLKRVADGPNTKEMWHKLIDGVK